MKNSVAPALTGAMMAVAASGLMKFLERLLTQRHRPGSHADRVVKHFKAHEGCDQEFDPKHPEKPGRSVGSRQRLRAVARKARLKAINQQFGKELRPQRRGFALQPFKIKSWKKGPRAGRHQ